MFTTKKVVRRLPVVALIHFDNPFDQDNDDAEEGGSAGDDWRETADNDVAAAQDTLSGSTQDDPPAKEQNGRSSF